MRIPLSSIFIGRRQRTDYGKAELEALRKDLEENGQITAITVRPVSDYDRAQEGYDGEEWALVAGGRRVMAAALLDWETIEGYAREELKELTHRILELHENLHRKQMEWQEEVDAKKEISRLRRLENPEITDGEIARELGQSAATFSRDVRTAQLLESNPGLRGARSKHAALNAGRLVEEHQLRSARITSQPSDRSDLIGIPPLEERVRTDEAVEFVKKLPARSIDLGLFDGPYGYNYWKSGQKLSSAELQKGSHLSHYDDDPERTGEMYREFLPEVVRTVRETGWLVFFCGKETYDFLEELAQDCCATHGAYRHAQYSNQCSVGVHPGSIGECRFLFPEPYPWIWYRPNSRNNPRYKERHAKNMMELILVINMGKGRIVKQPCPNVLVHDAEYGRERVHANQKPISLYRDLVDRFTFTGDSVLDTFFGSGNSLAAVSSLARIPWGCDKNPEMLQFALGGIKRYQQPITREAVRASHERYQHGLQMTLPPDDPGEEEEGTAPTPFIVSRAAAEGFVYETLKLPGGEWLGYIKYDDHNMGQRRASSEDELEDQLMKDCETLNNLVGLGVLDPCCCSPEDVMRALTYEEGTEAV